MSPSWALVGQVCQQPPSKIRGFLSVGLLTCDKDPLCIQHPPGLLCVARELAGPGGHAAVLGVMLSFVSDQESHDFFLNLNKCGRIT